MSKKVALISGITGQDGSFLARVPDRKRIRSTWYPETFFFI